MSSMNFTCDVCGREVFSCTFVNGMKFCAKCYQETFGETDKDRKIADLEAKLAEKEKEIESYKHFKITIGTMENNQVDISSTTYTDQDKISFAVEQLEKLKVELHIIHTNGYLKAIDEEIDNQINGLKGEK